MNKFFLPLNIANRRINIQHLSPTADRIESLNFIICPLGSDYCLFSIDSATKLLAGFGTLHDIDVETLGFQLDFDDTNDDDLQLNIQIINVEQNNDFWGNNKNTEERFTISPRAELYGFRIAEDEENDRINFLVNAIKIGYKSINCQITFNTEDFEYKGYFSLKTTHNNHLVEAVLDFGSEASQLAFTTGDRTSLEFVNFVNELNNNFYFKHTTTDNGLAAINDDEYTATYQYDQSDVNLLRSNFFIQKTAGTIGGDSKKALHHYEAPLHFGKDAWIKILAKRSLDFYGNPKTSSHLLLPNFKLDRLLGNNESKIKNVQFDVQINDGLSIFNEAISGSFSRFKDHIYRCLLNQIIHTALAKFDNEYDEINCLILALLVPNVYEQKDVYELIQNLQKDVSIACKKYNYTIQSVEIRAVSESDASFLGLVYGSDKLRDLVQIETNASYLIIDGGKGTMDLSIVHYDDDEKWLCKFRSGFPGSGNAITFAFADTILALIAGNQRKQYFQTLINEADWNVIYDFYENLEQLKINYSTASSRKTIADIKQLEIDNKIIDNVDLKLETINVFLKHLVDNSWSIDDYFGLIDQTLNTIINDLEQIFIKSGGVKCKQVLLAGRAFLFQPFKEKINKWVRTNKIADLDVVFVDNKAKSLCVLGPLNSEQGVDRGTSLVGIPIFREKVVQKVNKGLLVNVAPKFLKKIIDQQQKQSYREKTPTQQQLFFEGFEQDFDNDGQENIFSISGREYRVHNIENVADKQLNIFFAGDGFVFRNETGSFACRALLDDETKAFPLLRKSLFPYSTDNIEFSEIDESVKHTVALPTPEPIIEQPPIVDFDKPKVKRKIKSIPPNLKPLVALGTDSITAANTIEATPEVETIKSTETEEKIEVGQSVIEPTEVKEDKKAIEQLKTTEKATEKVTNKEKEVSKEEDTTKETGDWLGLLEDIE